MLFVTLSDCNVRHKVTNNVNIKMIKLKCWKCICRYFFHPTMLYVETMMFFLFLDNMKPLTKKINIAKLTSTKYKLRANPGYTEVTVKYFKANITNIKQVKFKHFMVSRINFILMIKIIEANYIGM